jgi:hypothetical protein
MTEDGDDKTSELEDRVSELEEEINAISQAHHAYDTIFAELFHALYLESNGNADLVKRVLRRSLESTSSRFPSDYAAQVQLTIRDIFGVLDD